MAFKLSSNLVTFSLKLKQDIYNIDVIVICLNFDHVNASYNPKFTRWEASPGTIDYISKYYWSLSEGKDDYGTLSYGDYLRMYELLNGTYIRTDLPLASTSTHEAQTSSSSNATR